MANLYPSPITWWTSTGPWRLAGNDLLSQNWKTSACTQDQRSCLYYCNIKTQLQVFHYAIQLFEGLKVYRGVDGAIRMIRPELNMDRMRKSGARCALPDFDSEELIQVMIELVRV